MFSNCYLHPLPVRVSIDTREFILHRFWITDRLDISGDVLFPYFCRPVLPIIACLLQERLVKYSSLFTTRAVAIIQYCILIWRGVCDLKTKDIKICAFMSLLCGRAVSRKTGFLYFIQTQIIPGDYGLLITIEETTFMLTERTNMEKQTELLC